MKLDPMDEAERWLAQSQSDLEDARFTREGGRHNLACFLSHQAVEKALKAFLFAQGLEVVRGNSLKDLCREAMQYDADLAELKQAAASLGQYYIPTRYPNGLDGETPSESYDLGDSTLALGRAESVVKAIASKIERLKEEKQSGETDDVEDT